MKQVLQPKQEGDWFWTKNEPIGNWSFCKKICYDDRFHTESELLERWAEISDAEKVAKEEEQEEWRKEQIPQIEETGGQTNE